VARRKSPLIIKRDQVVETDREVFIRPPQGTHEGPTVCLRTEPDGRPVLDVTCTCGRRFDVLLEEER
jgi:hypothetical protein